MWPVDLTHPCAEDRWPASGTHTAPLRTYVRSRHGGGNLSPVDAGGRRARRANPVGRRARLATAGTPLPVTPRQTTRQTGVLNGAERRLIHPEARCAVNEHVPSSVELERRPRDRQAAVLF